ncbi:DUF1737 domain-containing protein [Pengzhenrongella phosphoraccumulans]|uniref:DUF1737 domain-containing protein n=1 Tax=Pengzhenrongella phosphoraccumulans TaxID=3114394 RepID=UPI0038911377
MSTLTTPATDPTGTGEDRLRYRLLTGPDDRTFCERVSAALDDGYRLHGNPAVTFNGTRVIVAQAVVLDHAIQDDPPAVPTWTAITAQPAATA